MIWLFAAQFAVPLVLIGWLAWVPARSGLGFVVQVFASVAALAVMALQGIWLLPPWWAPFVFVAALGGAAWLGWRRIRAVASALPTPAPMPSTARVCWRPARGMCASPWTGCPTCRCPRSTVITWPATM